ncbi:hypothetical protein DFH01_21495 [Falsiroseomonas bella]|uniref:Uncharacterized protein n=1 Tax=Falsiroseomonas bella TaxID=2184016 RepID=A0A317F922_9PROT|nr:hypothetical protein [Falsiroseomonas bella]PWS34923.1 hypothetical protein DFH01_21495 [Falsiroseomonas bella]
MDAALERRNLARLRDDAGPLVEAMPPEAQPFAEFVLHELARAAARLDMLEAAQQEARLSREERLRLDPLRFIPAARLAAALGPAAAAEAGPVAVTPGAPDFIGQGWWETEQTEGGALTWSGAARCATLLLPALGGGELVLTLCLRSPFGLPLDIAEHDIFLDGVPLAFDTVSNDGTVGIFEARPVLPELPAGARLTFLLHGPQHEDPSRGPRRDTRRIGLGLLWVRLERA